MIDLDGLRVFGAPCNSLPKVGITLASPWSQPWTSGHPPRLYLNH